MGHAPRLHTLGLFGTDAALTALAGAHLAHALGLRGTPVWVMDEAAAPHNAATALGAVTRTTFDQALRREEAVHNALIEAAPGVYCLPALGGLPGLAAVPEMRWRAAVEVLAARSPQPECLLLVAPCAHEATSLAVCAQHRLLVLPQGRQALTRAYALLKGVQRSHPAQSWLVLVMQATDEEAAHATYTALEGTARRFLGLRPHWLGSVPQDPVLTTAMRQMRSAREIPAERPAMQAFRRLADVLMDALAPAGLYPPEEFWLKMWLFSRMLVDTPPQRQPDAQPN